MVTELDSQQRLVKHTILRMVMPLFNARILATPRE